MPVIDENDIGLVLLDDFTEHKENQETDILHITETERTKLAAIEAQANKYTHPESHPASMITGLPTSLPADGGDADTVNGKTVETDVPAGALFTDTIGGGDADTVNGKTVETDVPADAIFTDTHYTAGENITIEENAISATDGIDVLSNVVGIGDKIVTGMVLVMKDDNGYYMREDGLGSDMLCYSANGYFAFPLNATVV